MDSKTVLIGGISCDGLPLGEHDKPIGNFLAACTGVVPVFVLEYVFQLIVSIILWKYREKERFGELASSLENFEEEGFVRSRVYTCIYV